MIRVVVPLVSHCHRARVSRQSADDANGQVTKSGTTNAEERDTTRDKADGGKRVLISRRDNNYTANPKLS